MNQQKMTSTKNPPCTKFMERTEQKKETDKIPYFCLTYLYVPQIHMKRSTRKYGKN